MSRVQSSPAAPFSRRVKLGVGFPCVLTIGTKQEYLALMLCFTCGVDRMKLPKIPLAVSRKIAVLTNRNAILEADLRALKARVTPLNQDICTTDRGHAAQLYVKYLLTRLGVPYFDPPEGSRSIDILVQTASRFLRVEVKGTTKKDVHVNRASRKAERGIVKYSADDQIDVFIFVDLTHEYVFIVPYSEMKTRELLRLTPRSWVWEYKDNFNVLR